MANVDIKIEDDYYKNMGKLYVEWYKDLQAGVDKYIKILECILEDAIMEGDTAKALEAFLNYAKTLSGIIEPLGAECEGLCVNYISEVDEADSYLY